MTPPPIGPPIPFQIALNVIAREAFRDQADLDYVTARQCWRMKFREQFFWAALQAHEKYLKAILLFNGRSSIAPFGAPKGLTYNHNLPLLVDEISTIANVPFTAPQWMKQFYVHLTDFGNNRYLTGHTYIRADYQRRLDESVWCVRRYCQDVRVKVQLSPTNTVDLTKGTIAHIENPMHRKRPTRYHPFKGVLEEILEREPTDQARRALVWNNMFYGTRVRHTLTYAMWQSSAVPPVQRPWAQDPRVLTRLRKYVIF